jgi:putative transcriptional regulator
VTCEEALQELVERVLRYLVSRGYRSAVVEYPHTNRRSIDVVSWSRDRRVFIRVSTDIDELYSESIRELAAVASALRASPVIVGARARSGELEDYVVYEKQGLPAVTPETLGEALDTDGFYVIGKKGGFYARINPRRLREEREKRGMSLGEVAHAIGTSRKAVYEYEHGSMDPALSVSERLVRIFGEEILEPVKVFRKPADAEPPSRPHSEEEERVMERLRRQRYRVVHAARAPLDIAASRSDDEVAIVVKHGRDKALFERSSQVAEMASTIRVRALAIVDDPEVARDLEALGIEVVRSSELREDKRHSDNR